MSKQRFAKSVQTEDRNLSGSVKYLGLSCPGSWQNREQLTKRGEPSELFWEGGFVLKVLQLGRDTHRNHCCNRAGDLSLLLSSVDCLSKGHFTL